MFEALKTVPLFGEVDEATLQLLEPLFELRRHPEGVTIFEQGDPANYLYLILDGLVEVLYKPYDGPTISMTTLDRGRIFGWSAVVGNLTYTSGAVCKMDCELIRVLGKDLRTLCAENPEAGRIILDRLADSVSNRWENAQSQIQALLSDSMVTNSKSRKAGM